MIAAQIKLLQDDCKKSCTSIASIEAIRHQTILITGGTGFMGKWLAEMISFLNDNHNFNIKTYLLARNIEQFKMEVPHLAKKSYFHFIEQDIRSLFEIPQDINYIIHAAGSPDSSEHSSQPIKTIETFVKGTNSLLEASFRLPDLKKFLHISSHQVYGNVESAEKIKETTQGKSDCYSLNSIYSEAKRIAETYCSIYRNQYRLPVVVARPFAFLGPYQSLNKHWAINSFIRDGLMGNSIRILGNENTVRSYLYGSDMAFWLLNILVNSTAGECYNLGSNSGINLKDLAEKIKSKLNNNISIVTKSSKENYADTSILVPDNSKIISRLNVSENYTIDEALARTIAWNQAINNF